MVALGDGDGVGANTGVGVAWRVGDGVGSKVGEVVGAKVPVGDPPVADGEGVQLNAKRRATNPNDIVRSLLIAVGACRVGAEWTCLV